jgi:transposase
MRFVVNGVDKARKEEHKTRLAEGDSTLKGTKYLWPWSKEPTHAKAGCPLIILRLAI